MTTTPTRSKPTSPHDDATLASKQAELRDAGVKYCLSSFVDVHGVTKAKSVPIEHFVQMMNGSELFTGAAIDGLGQEPSDDELAVWPDLEAITVMPWDRSLAWAPGSLMLHSDPWEMDSRNVLKRQRERLAERGLILNLGIEPEFFLVTRDEEGNVVPFDPKNVISKAAYDITNLLSAQPFLDQLISYMNELGWNVHSYDHEDANGQFELDFSYAECLTMADRLTMLKLMAKVLARQHGFEATFMPKPYSNRTGSGGHFNMSMANAETGENAFADPDDPRGCGISKLAYHFIAGVLAHAKAIIAVTGPTVNSYKRLVIEGSMTGFTWAPVFISYGNNNRTHMVRVPMNSPRVESRGVDISVNPYLGAAMMIGAGLDGIERELDPGDPIDLNMYLQSQEKLDELGVDTLPRTLLEAVEAFAADPLSEQVFGKELRDAYIELKSAEWWDYHNTVSDWEYDRYLEFF
jgi:glutamine synthetase